MYCPSAADAHVFATRQSVARNRLSASAFAMYEVGSVLVEVGHTTAAGTVLVGRMLSAEDTK
jgi:hypothetical protein